MLNETVLAKRRSAHMTRGTPLHSGDVFVRHAILDRLADGPRTSEALAALLNTDLGRTRVALASLVAQGRVARVGILFGLAR